MPAAADVVPARRSPPLPLFALLEAPYGMQATLYVVVPMYLMRNAGVSIEKAGAISALAIVPATFYFAYAPIVDFFMRRRTWLLLAVLTTALLCGSAIAWSPATHLQLVTGLLFASKVASMLISAATGGLMASMLDRAGKARVGAWVQIGNLGANSLFFGLLLFLIPHTTRPVLALVATLSILLPGLAVLAVDEPPRIAGTETYSSTLRGIGRELRSTFFSLRSLPGILLLVSPLGSSAILTVLSGLTGSYGASAAQLGFANGWGGGLFCAAGALCVLAMPAHWNRMIPYALSGIGYGAVSLLIGAAPLRPSTLIVGMLASNFAQGICYAAYTGVILQTMGIGGRCQSSRYTILNSAGNLPVVYMTAIEGVVAGRYGAHSVGLFDGAMNLLTVAIFFAWWAWIRVRNSSFVEVPDRLAEA
jgi:hypothetical protein